MMEGIELPNQEKKQNVSRKGNLQVLKNIKSGHNQINGEETKILKKGSQENEKTTRNQAIE